jgi:hypothetical protein
LTAGLQSLSLLRAIGAQRSVYSGIIMEAMRNDWPDDRLDAFQGETRHHFNEANKRFDKVEGEIKAEAKGLRTEIKDEVKGLRGEMNARFDAVDARFDSLQRTMLWFSGVLIVALLGFMVTQAWFMITQV